MDTIKAAVFRQAHEPLRIEAIQIDEPQAYEVLVKIAASGVCHSDLHYVDGDSVATAYGPGELVLGHEAAGIVEAVGDRVTYVKPGDHVISCLSVFCGICEQCLQGNPARCQRRLSARAAGSAPRLSRNGEPLAQFVGLGTYAEKMLVHENALVKVDNDMPLDRAALLGCGVLTGVGAALNTAKVVPGSTVAVFGCGGVGLSIIQGALIAGARQIIGVDRFESKFEMAQKFGATQAVNASKEDPVEAIKRLTDGAGVDYAFEAVGRPELVPQMINSLGVAGVATVVGVMPAGARYEFDARSLFGEKKLQTCSMGSNRFRVEIPHYIELYRQGRLQLDDMVSRHLPLEDINEAFRAMKAGEVARNVLVMN